MKQIPDDGRLLNGSSNWMANARQLSEGDYVPLKSMTTWVTVLH